MIRVSARVRRSMCTLAACCAMSGAVPVFAQEATDATPLTAGVDPASIAVPDLGFTPTKDDTERFYKFFYFQKNGVAFEQAARDLVECDGYADLDAMYVDLPQFVPYSLPDEGRSSARQFAASAGSYGIVGSVMVGLITDGLLDKVKLGNRITCMGYKGYKRYGLSRDLWKAVNEGELRDVVLRNAKIASGPAPSAESLWP